MLIKQKLIIFSLLSYPIWGGIFSGLYTFFCDEVVKQTVVMISIDESKVTGKRFISGYSDLMIYTNQGNAFRINTSLLGKKLYTHRHEIKSNDVKIYTAKNDYNFFQLSDDFIVYQLEVNDEIIINKWHGLYLYVSKIFMYVLLASPLWITLIIFIKLRKVLQ